MSTNAYIGLLKPDGSIYYIYCHFDGYLGGAGNMLRRHYVTPDKVDQLIALGDLSSLGPEIDSEDTVSYWRDRNEPFYFNYATSEVAYVKDAGKGVYLYLGKIIDGQIEWYIYWETPKGGKEWAPLDFAMNSIQDP